MSVGVAGPVAVSWVTLMGMPAMSNVADRKVAPVFAGTV